MDNTEKDWRKRRYQFNTDVVVISPFINPKSMMYSSHSIPMESPLHPSYKEPPHDFGESIL